MYLKFLWHDLGGVCEREECCIPLSYYSLFKQPDLLIGILSRHAFFQGLRRCPDLQKLLDLKGLVEGPFLKVKIHTSVDCFSFSLLLLISASG